MDATGMSSVLNVNPLVRRDYELVYREANPHRRWSLALTEPRALEISEEIESLFLSQYEGNYSKACFAISALQDYVKAKKNPLLDCITAPNIEKVARCLLLSFQEAASKVENVALTDAEGVREFLESQSYFKCTTENDLEKLLKIADNLPEDLSLIAKGKFFRYLSFLEGDLKGARRCDFDQKAISYLCQACEEGAIAAVEELKEMIGESKVPHLCLAESCVTLVKFYAKNNLRKMFDWRGLAEWHFEMALKQGEPKAAFRMTLGAFPHTTFNLDSAAAVIRQCMKNQRSSDITCLRRLFAEGTELPESCEKLREQALEVLKKHQIDEV